MAFSTKTARLVLAAGIGTGAVAGAVLFGTAATAVADEPNCTAADLAGVSSGVASATRDYLFSHPDVNTFFTSLKGQPRSQISDDVQNYLSGNPQAKADLQGIRQPLVDFRSRCGVSSPSGLAPAPSNSTSQQPASSGPQEPASSGALQPAPSG
ncbi:MAG TPA: heme-binding protein [Propionibacteriaceae bacterium]|nr:heme-binding protein [Propionibacteriaceae bacterium]